MQKTTRSKKAKKDKISGVKAELFGKTVLPEWDIDRFFDCQQILARGEGDEATKDLFARLLMRFVIMRIKSKVGAPAKALAHKGYSKREIVTELVNTLYTRFIRFEMRTPVPKVLVSCMDTSISRIIYGMARSADRLGADLASDVFQHVDGDPLGLQFSGSDDRTRPALIAQEIAREDENFVADLMHQPKDASALRICWRFVVRQILRDRGVKPLSLQPNRLRKRISNEQYTAIVVRARTVFHHRLCV